MNYSKKKRQQKRNSGKCRRIAILLIAMGGLLGIANSSFAESIRVSSYSELRNAINNFNSGSSGNTIIEIDGTINLAGDLPAILGNNDYNLTITSVNNGTINGTGEYRGFYIDTAGTNSSVEIEGLSFENCVAEGGQGGSGSVTGGGGLGAGGAIYARSGDIRLIDVSFENNQANGGDGGSILAESHAVGGGGGLSVDGGGDIVTEPNSDIVVGDGGGTGYQGSEGNNAGLNERSVTAGNGGGVPYEEGEEPEGWNREPHTEGGRSGLVGGDGGYGGGGGASTYYGGDGGEGGGGGAGLIAGGLGGFGGGGGGGSDENNGGVGGFAAGNGGYQSDLTTTVTGGGVGGGGAGLGGALFVEEGANVSIVYSNGSTVFSGNSAEGGNAGSIMGMPDYSGNAQDGEGIGNAIFLKDDLTIDVQGEAQVIVRDNIGGYAGATQNVGVYQDSNKGGIVKNGSGTLVLDINNDSASSYSGNTTINEGKIIAATENAISQYSDLVVNNGAFQLNADQSVENLYSDSLESEGSESASGNGSVNLNGNNLTVSQGSEDGNSVYRGTIVDATGNGSLIKEGNGILRIASDNRGATINAGSSTNIANIFTTKILGGTIQMDHEGALGDGTILFGQTEYNVDQANSLQVGNDAFDENRSATIANNILLSGTEPMRIGVASDVDSSRNVVLSGQIKTDSTNSEATGVLQMNMNNAQQVLEISNTGIDSETKRRVAANANNFSEIQLNQGTLRVLAERETGIYNEETEEWSGSGNWYNSLGNAVITNLTDQTVLQIIRNANGYEETSPVVLGNNINLDAGLLNITNDHQDLKLTGTLSGNGGLLIDLSESSNVLAITGNLQYKGETRLKSGIFDLSNANGSATGNVTLGALSSAEGANGIAVVLGQKSLTINSDADSSYTGIIADSLDEPSETGKVNIIKKGNGVWTLNLVDNGVSGASNIGQITVGGGYLGLTDQNGLNQKTLNDDSVVDAVLVKLEDGGGIKVHDGQTVSLDNLDASTANTKIVVGTDSSLTLSNLNTITKIRSGFSGKGTVLFQNIYAAAEDDAEPSLQAWQLSGNNDNWAGIFKTEDNGELQLTSSKSVGNQSTIDLGKETLLSVFLDNDLGTLILQGNGNIKVASEKTLSISNLNGSDILSISGGGTVALESGAASSLAEKSGMFNGTTKINASTLLVKGDNQTHFENRGDTWLTSAGILELNYEGVELPESGIYGNLWGAEDINIQNSGGITISGTTGNVLLGNTIHFVNNSETPTNNIFQIDTGNAVVTFNGEIEYNEEVKDKGILNKLGNGTLILNGSDAFDTALLNAGTLQLGVDSLDDNQTNNSQLAQADIITAAGTTLTGWANSFGALTLNGTLSLKGTPTTTLNAESGTNAFAMNTGSVVDINVENEDNYTKFQTTDGNIALNGGTFQVNLNNEIEEGTRLTIFDTENGYLSANIKKLSVVDNVVGKRFVMNTENNRQFNLIWQKINYTDNVLSNNGRGVGMALARWADDPNLSEQFGKFLNALENEQINNPDVVGELSGEVRYSAITAQMLNRTQIRQSLSQKVTPRASTGSNSILRGQMIERNGLSGWMSVYGMSGDVDSHKQTSGFDYNLMGGIFGLELGSNATQQFGLFYSYSNSDVKTGTRIGSVDLNENIFGTYFRWNDRFGYGLALGSLGITDYSTNRSFNIGTYAGNFDSSQDGWSGNVYLERGYTFGLGQMNLQPYGGLQYTFIHQDDYNESGWNGLNLIGNKTDYDSLQSVLGLRLNREMALRGRLLDVSVYTNWTHEFLETSANGYAAFSGNPNVPFRVVGNGLGRDFVMFGIGGNWTINDRLQFFGNCDLQLNDYVQTVSGSAGAQYSW
ncbi:MAG: autotransporter domain-containing protein [Planctomycetia bacterium]|nr:autotransporter domain-containing protein [Planctomycetia bacterium]